MKKKLGRKCARYVVAGAVRLRLHTSHIALCEVCSRTDFKVGSLAEGNSVVMEGVDAEGDRNQKWKLDNGNRLLHKASNRVMTVVEDGVDLRKFYSDADTWKFTCMDNSRAKDDFVEYTPWQDMITWG